MELLKGHRSRQQEEHLAAALVLNLVAEACDIAERLEIDLLPQEPIERQIKQAPRIGRICWPAGRRESAIACRKISTLTPS